MNNDFKNAVKGWLEAIMPSVAATIADVLTPEAPAVLDSDLGAVRLCRLFDAKTRPSAY